MSEWGERIGKEVRDHGDRIGSLEGAVRNLEGARAYPPEAERHDTELRRSIDRMAREWVSVRLGNVAGVTTAAVASANIFEPSEHTWDSSYPTGGETLNSFPTVTNRVTVLMQGAPPYQFVWDDATSKMEVWQAGTEVAPATDLSALGTIPYIVLGSTDAVAASYATASERFPLRRSRGSEALLRVEIEVGTEIAKHATNYWTFKLYHRRTVNDVLETTGRLLATLSTATYKLAAGSPRLVYDLDTGLELADGDRLELSAVESGQATALDQAVVWLDIRRKVR